MRETDYTPKLCKSGQIIEMMRPLVQAMNRSGYFYSLRFDMDGWAKARAKLDPEHQIVMPAYDPAVCDQSKSYWIQVTDETGETIAVIASRRFDTPNFVELMKTGHVWADQPQHHRLELSLPDDFTMGGTIVYRGGLCVKKEHRKSGLSWALPRLVALLSIDHGVDYIVSHNLADLHKNGFTFRVYGHSGSELCFDGSEYFPPTADRRKAYLVWTDLSSAINNARGDHTAFIAGGNKQLSDLAVLAYGPNEVPVGSDVGAPLLHHRKSRDG